MLRPWIVGLVLLAAPPPAWAEASDSEKARAAAHFERGLGLVKNGEIAAAVGAFEAAYQTSPHYSVLYNLGQAYVALGKPAKAVQALERYLREGAGRIDAARRQQVEELVASQRRRLGQVEVEASPGSEILVDGEPVATAPLDGPLALGAGVRVIAARKPGFLPRAQALDVRPSETTRLSLELEPEATNAPPAVGQLELSCDLPGVEIWIDGVRRKTTPLTAPLLVPAGKRRVRLARPGYLPLEKSLAIAPDRPARLGCGLALDPKARDHGFLEVAPSEPFALVYVDGEPYAGRPLPPGPHSVRVERSGYRTWSRIVTLERGRRLELGVLLEPTPDRIAEIDAERRRRNAWTIGLGAGGLALGAGAVVLYAWNRGRYEDWVADRDRVDAALGSGSATPALYEDNRELAGRAADIQRADDAVLGLAIAGGGALISAAVVWLTSPEKPSAR